MLAWPGLFTNMRSARRPGPVVGGRGVLMLRHPLRLSTPLPRRHPAGYMRITREESGLAASDAGAEPAQALGDPLIAAIDLMPVADDRGALRTEGGSEEGHARPDVRRDHVRPVEPARPRYHRAVRIAEDDACPHVDETIHEEEAALEELLMDQHGARALRGKDEGGRGEIGRKAGPRRVVHGGNGAAHVVGDG